MEFPYVSNIYNAYARRHSNGIYIINIYTERHSLTFCVKMGVSLVEVQYILHTIATRYTEIERSGGTRQNWESYITHGHMLQRDFTVEAKTPERKQTERQGVEIGAPSSTHFSIVLSTST